MNDFFRKVSRYGFIYFILIAVFTGLSVFSAALPHSRKFDSLMRRSARLLAKDGEWPESVGVTRDNFTDSTILNVAYSLESNHPIRSAMESTLYEEKRWPPVPTHALYLLTTGEREKLHRSYYARYWFGHSAVMKILHFFWDIRRIYAFYGGIILLLAFLASLQINKTYGRTGVFALFILLGLCNFHVFFQSLQFPPVVIIGLGGLIWLYHQKDLSWRGPTFFALGMLTAYFDLLTAPILAFGIPALFIGGKDLLESEPSAQSHWKNFFRIGCGYPASWLAGYVLSWGTKILLGIWVTGNHQIVIHQILMYSGISAENRTISHWQAVFRNFQILFDNTLLLLFVIGFTAILSSAAILFKWEKHALTFNSRLGVHCMMLAFMPIAVVWLMVYHTYIHYWMTYRGLALTFASLFMLLTAFQPKKKDLP